MNILISGGSGMLGRAITRDLKQNGHQIGWLSRKPGNEPGVEIFHWDPSRMYMDPKATGWADAIINLAGESIGDTPWNNAGKKRILESRILSVRTLAIALAGRTKPLQSFVGVSGAGIYGSSFTPKSENDPPGNDFPAQVAKAWENEYQTIRDLSPRHFSLLRLGVVLSNSGGAFPRIVQPIRWGIGSPLGSGKQPFNWIHLEDATRGFAEALEWDGIYNLSAPENLSNREVTVRTARRLHRPLLLPPVPAFALRLFLGERADLVLKGNVSNVDRLLATGFQFRYPRFQAALEDLIP